MFRYDYHYYKSDDLNRAIDRCVKAGIGLVAMKTQVGGMTLPDKFNPFKQRGLNQHQAAIKAVAVDERITSICSEMTNENHDAAERGSGREQADPCRSRSHPGTRAPCQPSLVPGLRPRLPRRKRRGPDTSPSPTRCAS